MPAADNVRNLVAWILGDPQRLAGLSTRGLDRLIQQARVAGLAARLRAVLEREGLLQGLPERARRSLEAARVHACKQHRQVAWEAACLELVLGPLGQPVLLLKGGAYVAAGLDAGQGRTLSDIDILVPRERLDAIEQRLHFDGWMRQKDNEYDQRYYREWGHELPPLQHIRRGTVLDVHHTILPPTARFTVDGAKLLARAVALPGRPGVMTLQPVDLVLHCIAHLFADGAMENGLRDLVDLRALLDEFSGTAGFWDTLVERALDLGLGRPLFYGLHFVACLLERPVPAEIQRRLRPQGPPAWQLVLVSAVFERALRPRHVDADDAFSGAARFAVYLRSHYLRMPWRMLLPHLTRKAWRRWRAGEAPA